MSSSRSSISVADRSSTHIQSTLVLSSSLVVSLLLLDSVRIPAHLLQIVLVVVGATDVLRVKVAATTFTRQRSSPSQLRSIVAASEFLVAFDQVIERCVLHLHVH